MPRHNRPLHPLLRHWIWWWSLLAAIALGLGLWGFLRDSQHLRDALYHAAQLFFFTYDGPEQPVWQLEVARWLAPILAAVGLWRWAVAKLGQRPAIFAGHAVVCGLGRRGTGFALQFQRAGAPVVAIERDPTNPNIQTCKERGIDTLVGDAARMELLRSAAVYNADRVLCLCGDWQDPTSDFVNKRIAEGVEKLARRLRSAEAGPLRCFIHISDLKWLDQLRAEALPQPGHPVEREYFNVARLAAKAMLEVPQCPFHSTGRPQQEIRHLILFGMDQVHQCALIEAARQWRRRAAWRAGQHRKLLVTMIDDEARAVAARLKQQYSQLQETCQLVAGPFHHESSETLWNERVAKLLQQVHKQNPQMRALALVASQRDEEAREAARELERSTRRAGFTFPIVLRIHSSWPFEQSLSADERERIYVFRIFDEVCVPEKLVPTIETIARAIHEEYLHHRLNDPDQPEQLGSRPALQPWEQLSAHYRQSNLGQARGMARCLQISKKRRYKIVPLQDLDQGTFELPEEDVEAIARREHQRYYESKGWRELGHPAAETWELLSDRYQEIAREQVRGWPRILAHAGFQLALD